MTAGQTYIVTARVYPVSGTVKMQVIVGGLRPSRRVQRWEPCARCIRPLPMYLASVQFIAMVARRLYVDAVSIVETDLSVAEVIQERGKAGETEDPEVVTAFDVQPVGVGLTTQTIAGLTTRHRFAMGVYAGAEDPLGHANTRWPDTQYRPNKQRDANGHETLLNWSADGKQLGQVTDALGNATAFGYDDANRLTSSLDADNRETAYIYDANHATPHDCGGANQLRPH
jgi:YD repeat-containing protein